MRQYILTVTGYDVPVLFLLRWLQATYDPTTVSLTRQGEVFIWVLRMRAALDVATLVARSRHYTQITEVIVVESNTDQSE